MKSEALKFSPVQFVKNYFAKPKGNRYELLDVLRGLAVVQMMVFHFCFLLKEFKLAFLDFSRNIYWTSFRVVIVSMFLSLVGISLTIAYHKGLNKKRYFGRLAQLLVYGLALSLTTYLINPQRTVYFGILQFIFIASILGLVFIRWHWQNLIAGILVCVLGITISEPMFNQQLFYWVGMATQKPYSMDYVPLFPWFGVVLIGLFLGKQVLYNSRFEFVKQWQSQKGISQLLAFIGRHSLDFYMVHVPVFFILILVYVRWV